MSGQIDIINFALHQLGVERINSLQENNKRARIAKDVYAMSRDDVLSEGYWTSCLKTKELTIVLDDGGNVVNPHPNPPNYTNARIQDPKKYRHVLPPDFIRAKEVSTPYYIDGQFIYSDESSILMVYVSNAIDVGRFSSSLARAIGYKLAMDMCFSITQSLELLQGLSQLYQITMDKGLGYSTIDADEGVTVISSSVNNVRGASSRRVPYEFNDG